MEREERKIKEKGKKQKKINLKLVVALFIIFLIALGIWYYIGTFVNIKNISDKRVLIEKSYSNYAWGFTYEGTILCEDGNIYEFKFDEDNSTYNGTNIEEESKNIISRVTKRKGKVKGKDLEKIKQYLGDIKEYYEYGSSETIDGGSNIIKYYNYNLNKQIIISESGDNQIKNNSKNVSEVLEILEKYM